MYVGDYDKEATSADDTQIYVIYNYKDTDTRTTSTYLEPRKTINTTEVLSAGSRENYETKNQKRFDWEILSRLRINDINSQWIQREGRRFRFDPPKKIIPRQKKFNRRIMKCNRIRETK